MGLSGEAESHQRIAPVKDDRDDRATTLPQNMPDQEGRREFRDANDEAQAIDRPGGDRVCEGEKAPEPNLDKRNGDRES